MTGRSGGYRAGRAARRWRGPARLRWRTAGRHRLLRAAAGRGGCPGRIPGRREDDGAGQGRLDGDGPELGEGGQGGVPVEGVPGECLGLVPAEGILSRLESGFSQPLLIPVKKKSSLAFRVHPGRY